MTVREALVEFLREKRLEGRRPATLAWYERQVQLLLRPYLDQPLETLTRSLVSTVLSRSVNPNTLANYDRALRGFCNWLTEVGYLSANPFRGRKRPKEEFKLKQVLTVEELKALYRVVQKESRFRWRNLALLSVFLSTGLRASEVCRLKVNDIDWELATLQVFGKTGHAAVPLTKDTLKALRLYVERERKATIPELFVYANKPLNIHALHRWLNRATRKAGIQRPIGLHLLRHTFATHFLRSGGDPFTLQRILRHRTPAMTSRYLHFLTDDLRDKLQPLDLVSLIRH